MNELNRRPTAGTGRPSGRKVKREAPHFSLGSRDYRSRALLEEAEERHDSGKASRGISLAPKKRRGCAFSEARIPIARTRGKRWRIGKTGERGIRREDPRGYGRREGRGLPRKSRNGEAEMLHRRPNASTAAIIMKKSDRVKRSKGAAERCSARVQSS